MEPNTSSDSNLTTGNATYRQPYNWHHVEGLRTYGPQIILFIGLPGNILSLIVLLRKPFRGTSSGLLLTILAIVDSGLLIVMLVPYCMSIWFGLYSYGTDMWCISSHYLEALFKYLSPWTIVLITSERFYAVMWPLKASQNLSARRVGVAWVILAIVAATITSPYLFVLRPFEGGCTYTEMSSDITKISLWIHAILAFLLPVTWILAANGIILTTLFRARRQRNNCTRNSRQAERSTTIMLVVVCIAFLLTTGPYSSFHVISMINPNIYTESIDTIWIINLANEVVDFLYPANSAINFYLYCISGTKFRRTFVGLFMTLKPHRESSVTQGGTRISYVDTEL